MKILMRRFILFLRLVRKVVTHVDFLNEQILELDTEVAKRLDPFQQDIERLDTIAGIGRRTAEQILAEVGTDVGSRFESAGKRKFSKTRKGNKYLRAALIEVAHSVCRSDKQRQQETLMKQAVRRLENLGFQVALSTSEAS